MVDLKHRFLEVFLKDFNSWRDQVASKRQNTGTKDFSVPDCSSQ
jgi:hypothetical protein